MFQVKKSSWHYKWYLIYGSLVNQTEPRDITKFNPGTFETDIIGEYSPIEVFEMRSFPPTNFCEYWRKVIVWPAIRIGLNLAAWLVSGALVYTSFASGGVAVAVNIGIFLFMAFLVLTAFAALLAVMFGFEKIKDFFSAKVEDAKADPDSLIAMAYNAHKEKICVGVNYEDDNA